MFSLRRLGRLWTVPFLCAVACVVLFESYKFDERWYTKRSIYQARLASLKPLVWNPGEGIFMTRPHEGKMLTDQRYLYSWYTSIGHGLVEVFLLTVL